MRRREFMELLAVAGAESLLADRLSGNDDAASPAPKKLVGMYVHQGWAYNHPYAARTWTDDDWRGYLDGLHRLGYNLVSIWPQLETMPHPLTPSDQAKLEQCRRVIDMAHRDFGMKAWIILCPNLIPIDDYARRAPFEKRSYYGAYIAVNPADARAMDDMMARRQSLLKPLAEMDGLVIIDSDPGGYPNSTNKEFVDLLIRHRQLLDRLRPRAIELIYWVWCGWQECGRFYATGKCDWGTEAEFLETLSLLKAGNIEPWGIARGLEYAQKLGLESKVINFNYAAVECEPSFPMTNFGPHGGGDPYQAGHNLGPRGAQANAQTHCVQLPGTFAFARGAQGLPLTDKDYARFADDLIQGQGQTILSAWKALAGLDQEPMLQSAAKLAPLTKAKLDPGPLKGFLFGDANRFMSDLYFMLRFKVACLDFIHAAENNQPLYEPLEKFVSWLDRWQVVTGYESWWGLDIGQDINHSLQKLQSPWMADFFRNIGRNYVKTGQGSLIERIDAANYRNETETRRLIQALKQTLWQMDPRWPDSSAPEPAPAGKS
jgi:hypothetical protein